MREFATDDGKRPPAEEMSGEPQAEETTVTETPPAQEPAPEPKAQFLATTIEGGRAIMLPRNFGQIWRLAELFASSGEMVPQMYRQHPERAAMAIMWGMELGVSPIQAIQGIAVIGGAPSVWGDLMHAIVQSHPEFDGCVETVERNEDGSVLSATCTTKRRGNPDVTRTFTNHDALVAGLLTKDTYKKYPARMFARRARSYAHRDQFADALKGLGSADELVDVDAHIIEQRPAEPRRKGAAALQARLERENDE